jgi:FkbM family methyltransferase
MEITKTYDDTSFPNGYDQLSKAYESKRVVKSTLSQVLKNAKKIIIYGAGRYGLDALMETRALGVRIDCICDANRELSGISICGIPVFFTDYLEQFDKDTVIIITPLLASVQIEKFLSEMGFTNLFIHEPIFTSHVALKFYSGNHDEKRQIATRNKKKIDLVRSSLVDEHSKAVFNSFMKLWLYGECEDTAKLCTSDGYYPSGIIKLNSEEVFVDCGAYNGDSILEFVKRTNGDYRMIYAYEADEFSCEIAKRAVVQRNINNVHIKNIGVFNRNTVLHFANDGSEGNRVISEGGTQIRVDSLDNLLEDRPFPVSFIKMDIEGSELEALQGAFEVISKDSPKLAISAYHRFGDIWEIPYYMLTNFPNYSIYIRNEHTFSDCVCFAVCAK